MHEKFVQHSYCQSNFIADQCQS